MLLVCGRATPTSDGARVVGAGSVRGAGFRRSLVAHPFRSFGIRWCTADFEVDPQAAPGHAVLRVLSNTLSWAEVCCASAKVEDSFSGMRGVARDPLRSFGDDSSGRKNGDAVCLTRRPSESVGGDKPVARDVEGRVKMS